MQVTTYWAGQRIDERIDTVHTEDMTPREPMKPKALRVPDDLWKAAQATADERGEVLSEVIRKFLETYVKSTKRGKS